MAGSLPEHQAVGDGRDVVPAGCAPARLLPGEWDCTTPFPNPPRTRGGQSHQCLGSFRSLGAGFPLSASSSATSPQGFWILINLGLSLFDGRY